LIAKFGGTAGEEPMIWFSQLVKAGLGMPPFVDDSGTPPVACFSSCTTMADAAPTGGCYTTSATYHSSVDGDLPGNCMDFVGNYLTYHSDQLAGLLSDIDTYAPYLCNVTDTTTVGGGLTNAQCGDLLTTFANDSFIEVGFLNAIGPIAGAGTASVMQLAEAILQSDVKHVADIIRSNAFATGVVTAGAATDSPTVNPTKLPTQNPTKPTTKPTKHPTKNPTTKAPSNKPTTKPTSNPTNPISKPTASPTKPTASTTKPTASPAKPTTSKPTTAKPTTKAPTEVSGASGMRTVVTQGLLIIATVAILSL